MEEKAETQYIHPFVPQIFTEHLQEETPPNILRSKSKQICPGLPQRPIIQGKTSGKPKTMGK